MEEKQEKRVGGTVSIKKRMNTQMKIADMSELLLTQTYGNQKLGTEKKKELRTTSLALETYIKRSN